MLTRIAVIFHALEARRLKHAQLCCMQTLAKLIFCKTCASSLRMHASHQLAHAHILQQQAERYQEQKQGSKSGALARQIARTWHACCLHSLQISHTNMLHSGSKDSPVEKAGVDLCNAGTAVTSTKINGSRMPRATRLMSQL